MVLPTWVRPAFSITRREPRLTAIVVATIRAETQLHKSLGDQRRAPSVA